MKTTAQLHHEEQMEAYRRDFAQYWKPWQNYHEWSGLDKNEIAMKELREWQRWLKGKKAFG